MELDSIDAVLTQLAERSYVCDRPLANPIYLALKAGKRGNEEEGAGGVYGVKETSCDGTSEKNEH